jgi:hypothetical protein
MLVIAAGCTSSGSPLAGAGTDGDGGGGNAGGASGNAARGGAAGASGGLGGASPFGGNGGGTAGAASDGGAAGDAGAGGKVPDVFVEPPGPSELLFVNGIVDVPSVRLCLVPVVAGVDAPGALKPLPNGAQLPYAGSFPIDLSPYANGAAHPVVVIGTDAAIGKHDCAALLDTKQPVPGVQLRSLPVFPEGTLTALRSFLLVATGCVSGDGVPDPSGLCGLGAAPPNGNAGAVLVEMSRVLPQGLFSAQFVHASRANEQLNLSTISKTTGQETRLATNVSFGGVAPRPPFRGPTETLFGLIPADATLSLTTSTSSPLATFNAGKTWARSGVPIGEVLDDRGFVFVLLGPRLAQGSVDGAGTAYPNTPRLLVVRAPATAL